ncbi:hypothetical protein [Marinomonas spartinae]|uniref:hypothetical protein n=1 Tax=Marinomonas spartinae TaxID=1792290 RepID=UPI0018F1A4F1|nr:hypothetical protein [Marinomonas spartinae]MBJ7554495.1 hypothetical protein [Marinomonas spartinae]
MMKTKAGTMTAIAETLMADNVFAIRQRIKSHLTLRTNSHPLFIIVRELVAKRSKVLTALLLFFLLIAGIPLDSNFFSPYNLTFTLQKLQLVGITALIFLPN